MTKEEFVRYVDYLKMIFNQDIPTDKVFINTWYKPFSKINKKIAQDMAEAYVKEETGRFKFAKLLDYKSLAMANKTYIEPKTYCDCKVCNGLGLVFVEKYWFNKATNKLTNRIYETTYRCTCSKGDTQARIIKQISPSDLDNHFKDHNGVYRLEDIKEDELQTENIEGLKSVLGANMEVSNE